MECKISYDNKFITYTVLTMVLSSILLYAKPSVILVQKVQKGSILHSLNDHQRFLFP